MLWQLPQKSFVHGLDTNEGLFALHKAFDLLFDMVVDIHENQRQVMFTTLVQHIEQHADSIVVDVRSRGEIKDNPRIATAIPHKILETLQKHLLRHVAFKAYDAIVHHSLFPCINQSLD